MAHNNNQRVTQNNWVVWGGALTKSGTPIIAIKIMKITTTIAIFTANSIAQPAVPFATSPVIALTFYSWLILFCVAVLMSIPFSMHMFSSTDFALLNFLIR